MTWGLGQIHQDEYWLNAPDYESHTIVGVRRNQVWKFYLNSWQGKLASVQVLVGCRKLHQT